MPSRHISLTKTAMLHDALERLHASNAMGWGAFYGLATRRFGLTRWQRGDLHALVEIPAIIADIDEPPDVVLPRVRAFPIPPSCIVSSGHGVHLYWLLDKPTTNTQTVNTIHRGLSRHLKGDYLTAATALRLPGSRNTKHDSTPPCEVLESDWSQRYTLYDFAAFQHAQTNSAYRSTTANPHTTNSPATLDPYLIQQIADAMLAQGFKRRDTWLNGPCPHPERHKHGDRHPSFGFNTMTGNGYCFVCGAMPIEVVNHNFSISRKRAL